MKETNVEIDRLKEELRVKNYELEGREKELHIILEKVYQGAKNILEEAPRSIFLLTQPDTGVVSTNESPDFKKIVNGTSKLIDRKREATDLQKEINDLQDQINTLTSKARIEERWEGKDG